MSCNEFAALVHELVDQRLPEVLAQQLRSHAAGCARCTGLLETDQWLVDVVGQLDAPRPPSERLAARIAQSIEGLAALEHRAHAFPHAITSDPARPAWMRWVVRAALILLSITIGVLLGHRLDRPVVPGQQAKQVPGPQASPPRPPAGDAPLPNTWQRVAKHLNAAEGLTRQVLNLEQPAIARKILKHELAQSRLGQQTSTLRDLAGTLPHKADQTQALEQYLTRTEKLVKTIDAYVNSGDQPLQAIQAKLRADGLLGQIAKLRQNVWVIDVSPVAQGAPEVTWSSDPCMQLYLHGRDLFYRGNRAQSLVIFQEVLRKFPHHQLHGNTRYWKQYLTQQGDRTHLVIKHYRTGTDGHPEARKDIAPDGAAASPRLVLDGRRHALRNPQQTALAVYQLWGTGQQLHLMQEASWGMVNDLRTITLTFKRDAAGNARIVTRFEKLRSVSGISGTLPRTLELIARDKDCPRYATPERKPHDKN